MKKRYIVRAIVGISVYTEVEAESLQEALDIADDRDLCSLSDPNSHGDKPCDVWCHSGEIDGTPKDLTVEEM